METSAIIGYAAAVLSTVSFVPQVIKTLKTKDTSGISLLMYSVFTAGVALWLIFGIMTANKPVTIANVIVLILASMVLAMKIRYK
ncbi:MAG TPA: SemiSWEET transporter [Spirochaetota bacterium]|jgi:MtN3 and saliva related transmembrane protein|nr:SemiSWEET transporter [Spirochaetota bacterium]HOH36450.1 SemiSWEET transporter [Spirochaetota bacterium]HPW50839.1 SemiSWEET transporter [Spirochaetota bacterium]HPY02192.1 SemiSWEET transporter [Spirochaetota bacterium]